MTTVLSAKSFALTIRPLGGITDAQVTMVDKWITKNSEYYHLITEKSGSQRHIHVGFILKEARSRSNVLQRILQLFKELSPSEKSVLRSGLKIMYNWDFIDSYLAKDDETVIINSCMPERRSIEGYFPPKPVPVATGKQRKCSLYYHELEGLWYKYQSPGIEVNTLTGRDFLFRLMYKERCIPVIRDDKQIIQTARHLVRWINKSSYSSIEIPPFEKEE